jgi:hypothetical protein
MKFTRINRVNLCHVQLLKSIPVHLVRLLKHCRSNCAVSFMRIVKEVKVQGTILPLGAIKSYFGMNIRPSTTFHWD